MKVTAYALATACAALAIADILFGPWDRDGGFYLMQATYTVAGLRPYLDYHLIYPPLMNFLNAPLVALPLSRLAVAFVLPALWIVANGAASAYLTWKVTKDRTLSALMAALSFVYCIENGGNHLTLEHGVVLFGMLALALALDPQSPLQYAGFTASLACLCKQNGVVILLPLAVLLLPRGVRRVGPFVLGFLVPPLAILARLGFHVQAIWQNLWHDSLAYAGATLPDTGWRNEMSRAPGTVVLFALALVAAIVVATRNRKLAPLVIATLIGGVLEFLPRVLRNYPHYNLNIWPFLALLFALALMQVNVRKGVLTGAIAVYAATLALQHFQTSTPQLVRLDQAAQTIRSVTPPNSVVRQYGAEPILEFLAERRQEQIDLPPSVFTRWDGSGIYNVPPLHDTTVVVVDRGQAWVTQVLAQLHGDDFAQVAPAIDAGVNVGRIVILRRPLTPFSH